MRTLRKIIKNIFDTHERVKLKRNKDIFIYPDVSGWKNVKFNGSNVIGRGANFSSSVELGYGTTIGPFNVITGPVKIGPYCQLGQFVGIYAQDHPTTYLTTYINKNLFNGRLREHISESEITIGAGVWIGHGAVILRGVHIGDGAIIGANAVVTKDVAPYMIVVGSPAKPIKARFSPEVISALEGLRWHTFTSEELQAFEPVFHMNFEQDPEKAIRELLAIQRKIDQRTLTAKEDF